MDGVKGPSNTSQLVLSHAAHRPGESRQPARAHAGHASKGHDPRSADAPDRVGELERVVQQAFQDKNVRLSILYHEKTGQFVYRGLSRETGEVVKQYPPEEVLEWKTRFTEVFAGLTLDRKL